MKPLAFYPGCALQAMSWDYRESIKIVTSALGLELHELKDWTCCGATAAHSLDEDMSVALPLRNLVSAEECGLDLAVACPMCFKRLTYTRLAVQQQGSAFPSAPALHSRVLDLGRLLASDELLERIRHQVRYPLTGLKVVSYYGCQVVRPPKITGHDDYENPQYLDRLVAAVGADAVDWSFKAVCCGASMGIPRRDIGRALIEKLLVQAYASGAQAIVACCPLCQSNLDLYQPELRRHNDLLRRHAPLPVLYYTELLGVALGLDAVQAALRCHLVDPVTIITSLHRRGTRHAQG
jgi:heterodisulfide reductase subunit B2